MPDGIEGQPPGIFGRGISQSPSHKAVGQLVQGDAQQSCRGADKEGEQAPPVHVVEKVGYGAQASAPLAQRSCQL